MLQRQLRRTAQAWERHAFLTFLRVASIVDVAVGDYYNRTQRSFIFNKTIINYSSANPHKSPYIVTIIMVIILVSIFS